MRASLKCYSVCNIKTLVPSINFQQENEHINFKDSPFYVNTELKDWHAQNHKLRRAAISSFGFSGTNAHLVIEEASEVRPRQTISKPAYLITMSAKTESSLKQKLVDLQSWLQKQLEPVSLASISYTLNTGRAHFNRRIAMVVTTVVDFHEKLASLRDDHAVAGCFRGDASKKPDDAAIYEQVLNSTLEDLKVQRDMPARTYKKKLEALANLYVKGYDLDWELLHQGESHDKISLPTYPFIHKRYWVPFDATTHKLQATVLPKTVPPAASCYYKSLWQQKSAEKTFECSVEPLLILDETDELSNFLRSKFNEEVIRQIASLT